MRCLMAGILILVMSTTALAQAEGEVEAVGFGGYARPNCWTGLRLVLRPKTGATEMYTLAVIQEDLDGDHVAYTRPFTLNGNPEGQQSAGERVWVYFLPQPRGLFGRGTTMTGGELTKAIRIYLCKNGRQLVQIPFQHNSMLMNLDDSGRSGAGARVVLVVTDSTDRPLLDQIYAPTKSAPAGARGLNEQMIFLRVSPKDLPGNAMAYGAVDAVVWMGADPGELDRDALAGLRDYVRDGGRLVVCHNQNWQRMNMSELGELLPVVVKGQERERNAASLRKMAGIDFKDQAGRAFDPWGDLQKQRSVIGRGEARPGALVVAWTARDATPANPAKWVIGSGSGAWAAEVMEQLRSEVRSPYLVRWVVGAGTVTWVAQNLGDASLISQARGEWQRYVGWEKVWDIALDLPNKTVTGHALEMEAALGRPRARLEYDRYQNSRGMAATVDLGGAMMPGMELSGKSAAFVALVVLFFVVYWAGAGLGSYFWLKAKRRSGWAWPVFAACALGATGLTVAVVKLVLRGPPEIRHVTFARVGADRSAVISSQFGLYIPRDGMQRIALKDAAAKRASFVAPYPMHPAYLQEMGASTVLAYMDYEVPVRDRSSGEDPAIAAPYRSTLKKFQAKWIGEVGGGIDGRVSTGRLPRDLSGKLVNNTGVDLSEVYLVYLPEPGMDDVMYRIKDVWKKGETLALEKLEARFPGPDRKVADEPVVAGHRAYLQQWIELWDADLRLGRVASADRAAVLISLFDRIGPDKANTVGQKEDRWELLRRSARQWDASGVVGAGRMLVLGRAEGVGLPFPLEVEGKRVGGVGTVYYQFDLPLERAGR